MKSILLKLAGAITFLGALVLAMTEVEDVEQDYFRRVAKQK